MRLLAQLVGVLLLLGFVGAYFWPIVAALMTASGSTPRGITTLPGQRPTGEPGWTRSDAVEARSGWRKISPTACSASWLSPPHVGTPRLMANRKRTRHEHTSVATSAMTANG